MDETELFAIEQMRMFGRAAGLSRETIDRQFDSIFNAPAKRRDANGRRDRRMTKPDSRSQHQGRGARRNG